MAESHEAAQETPDRTATRPAFVAVGGVLMVVCCLAPVFVVSVIASVSAWFSGLGIGASVALALFAAALVYGAIRLRNSRNAVGVDTPIGDDRDG